MKLQGYTDFSVHYHTQLWQSLDAKKSAKGYGTMVAGKAWHWYERWVDLVRKHCQEKKENFS